MTTHTADSLPHEHDITCEYFRRTVSKGDFGIVDEDTGVKLLASESAIPAHHIIIGHDVLPLEDQAARAAKDPHDRDVDKRFVSVDEELIVSAVSIRTKCGGNVYPAYPLYLHIDDVLFGT